MSTIYLLTINLGLRIVGIPQPATLGQSYLATLTGYAGLPPYVWSISGALPDGMTVTTDSNNDYVFSGTPTEAGTFPIVVTIMDSEGRSVSRSFDLLSQALPLTISGHLPNGTFGGTAAYSYTLGGGYGARVVTVYSGALPAGASISTAGAVSGTYTTAGSYSWVLQVEDSLGSKAYLSDSNAITYATLSSTGALTDADIGDPVGGSITLSGGDGTYTIDASPVSGTRPPGNGLALVGPVYSDSSGVTTTLGSYSWTDRFRSGDGQTLDVVCSISVRRLWTPADLATPPSIWLNDTSSVTNVSGAASQWDDISGNGYHVSQTTSANRPAITAAAQNGLRALTFDGATDQLQTTSGVATRQLFTNVTAGWIMYVAKKVSADVSGAYRFAVHVPAGNAGGNARAAMMMGSISPNGGIPMAIGRRLDADSNTTVVSSNGVRTNWLTSIGTMDFANRTVTLYVDGAQVAQSTTMSASGGATSNTASFTEITISGNNPSSPTAAACDMVVGEILIGGGYLPTPTEIEKLAGWAAWKWGLVANLDVSHPYKSAPPYV